jgi:hypothetical protein
MKIKDRLHSLDLDFLGTHSEDLSELEAAFTEEEIWEVIRRLPSGKAPGPDGFTAEFLQKCWGWSRAISWLPSTSCSRCVGADSRG